MTWIGVRTLLVVAAVVITVGLIAIFGTRDYTSSKPASACRTEAQTFQTALDAYAQRSHGARPASTRVAGVFAELQSSHHGGPYLQPSAKLEFADAVLPPQPKKWSYDVNAGKVVVGSQCSSH